MKKFGLFTVLAVLLLFFAVGCAQSVDEKDKVVQVGFSAQYGDDDSSRSLKIDVDTDYKVEDLFWTYKAVKKSGIHAKGQQTSHVSLSAGNTRGLAGYVKEFSTGKWDLEIKGYLDKAHTASKLIYSGSVTDYEITESTTDNTVIPIKLTLSSGHDYGTLKFGTLKIKVPENRAFSSNSELITTINDITSGTGTAAVKIAESTTALTAVKSEGTDVTLNSFTFVTGKDKFVTGAADTTSVRTFQVLIKYKDKATTGAGYEEMFSGTFQAHFRKGCTTTISGDFNDYVVGGKFFSPQPLGGYVFYMRPDNVTATRSPGGVSSEVIGNAQGEVWLNGNKYIFYKANGTPVDLSGVKYTSKYSAIRHESYDSKSGGSSLVCEQGATTSLITKLNSEAVYYTVAIRADTTKDYVFVAHVAKGLSTAWGGSLGSLPVDVISRVGASVPSTHTAADYDKSMYSIGMGKVNTNKIIAVDGVRRIESTETTAYASNGFRTLFDYLAWMNGKTSGNKSYWESESSRVPGCTDWYVPSLFEVQLLATCGVENSYFQTDKKHVRISNLRYRYGSKATPLASETRSDNWTLYKDTSSPGSDGWGSDPKHIRNGSLDPYGLLAADYSPSVVLVRSF